MLDFNVYVRVVHIIFITIFYVFILLRKLAEEFGLARELLILTLVAIHGVLPLHDLLPEAGSLQPPTFDLVRVCLQHVNEFFLEIDVEDVELLAVFGDLDVSVLLVEVLHVLVDVVVVFETLDLHRFKLHL